MDSLLSVAFDNLASYDGPKIRKGLRQIEGILAQICLSQSKAQASPSKKATTATIDPDGSPPKQEPVYKDLAELTTDPAFLEFFKMQEGFEWNVAQHLLDTLERLLSRSNDGQYDLLMVSTMEVIQGTLLLHPPSRGLFAREKTMNIFLDLLEPNDSPAVQSQCLLTLVVALLDTPQNTRKFEDLDGILALTSLFKSRSTPRDVKKRLMEFLYAYLMPETPSIPCAAARDSVPALLQRSPSKLAKAWGGKEEQQSIMRTTEEKTALLGRHLNNVEELVRDLVVFRPFGGAVC